MAINRGDFHVFTFKAGLLSSLAHDLRLGLKRFEIAVDGDRVTGRFWPDSLEVQGAMNKGRLDTKRLSKGDKDKIHGSIRQEILATNVYPLIELEARLDRAGGLDRRMLTGTLTIKGRQAPITVRVTPRGNRYVGEATLKPSDWGIPPFKALAGAIKLQDRLEVRFDLIAE